MTSRWTVGWAEESEIVEAAALLARVVRLDPQYISHGEVQCGLSPDGERWSPDLAELIERDLAERGPGRRVATARDEAGHLRAVAVTLDVVTARIRYSVIEDLAVDPDFRSMGIGKRMVDFIERESRARDSEWTFLESGMNNHDAHGFFERRGYRPVSKVFAKRL